ncbi:MAG: hypothetical protein KKA07_16725 [Bacteroidetes bacterium]|nr:hypothetical protein [Bacteroidota bacterium]MBU1720712.1 hypothetical protein [Bacteroidota bacterium]
MTEKEHTGKFWETHSNELKINPFQVPEGYFDSLPVLIADRVSTPDHRRGFIFMPRFYLPAFGFAILVIMVFLITNKKESIIEERVLNSDELASVIYDDPTLYDISEDLLIEIIGESAGDQTESEQEGAMEVTPAATQVTDENAIIDYLSESDIEELIYESY